MYHTLHATTDIPVDLSTLTKFLSSLMFPLFVFFLENTGRVLRLLRID